MERQISGQMEATSFEQRVELTQRIYLLWDDVLNYIWDYLKGNLDENTMRALAEEKLEWIASKETVMEETLTEDDLQLIKQNERAADMTKKRVYELYEYLE